MLYLEDYLELIEHLPQELRDRFTDIRERDLQVHNSSEQLNERVKLFFAEAKELKSEDKQCSYQKLIDEYEETMKYADDKVHIASQMHEIMVKLVQRLDNELDKFKLELEADHAGITEELERRSLQLDADSRLDDLINNHINHNSITSATTPSTSKTPSVIKDRRRSEHKQNRYHPYQNNHNSSNIYSNGYHGRAKLSNHHHNHHYQHNPSKNSLSHRNHHHHQQPSPTPFSSSSISAPASVAGDLNGSESGYYGNNLSSSSGNTSSLKNSASSKNNNLHNSTNANSQYNHQHSALSAALASNTSQLNSVSALAMMNAASVHNKISNDVKSNELIDPNSPLIRHNPIAAAASQAIAATQQLQQGRRTPSLKASFAAINGGGINTLDGLNAGNKHDNIPGGNRNALAPMDPDQQAYRYSQYGKMGNNANGNSGPLYVSVTKSGRPTKRPKHHASHLYPDESPTSISSDNSVFENSESLSSTDYIETGTTFGSASPSSLDFAANASQGNANLYHRDDTIYCICRQISYGEMVACDNKECDIEWFHYGCVGVTQPPKGTWFCPDCSRKMASHQTQEHNQSQTQKKRGRKEKSLFNLVNNSMDIVRQKDRDGCEQPAKSVV